MTPSQTNPTKAKSRQATQPIHVAFCQRRPIPNANFSVERVFEDIRCNLPQDIEATILIAPFRSQGLVRRLLNIVLVGVRRQEDVTHITGDITYMALLLKQRQTVMTFLDCVSLNRLTGLRYMLVKLLWYRLPISRARHMTCISESVKEELEERFPIARGRVLVVPCPVGNMFVGEPYIFRDRCPVLLQVGTGPTKNLPILAEALSGIDCHLRIVGILNEEQREALQWNGVSYSNVWGISEEQMVDEYRNCDVVTFVSTYEGFGLPILEGQATGRPVVTSAISSMPEVAGEGACLVNPHDAGDIRRGILRVLGEPEYRNCIVERGLENVRRFSAERIAEEYAQVYRRVYAENQGRA